ncbi:hypothetical protein F6X86_06705 [Enterococcus durans]|uniref:Uncharacterized protein n=1 Tax=Enterococcus durans TaxID=53345 RepID=A0A5N0YRW1_9ENTE|nr:MULTISPECIES: hypothetical protein [Enterococcus]KAA9178922.1 hypothetical protein F6X86_06705 [Enterococcus durans]KAA9182324.1 hypothetical protein F6X85_13790 [Enterococcus durans]KAA9186663.1 hypothetical protein F6X90_06660 [Enterococcus durans]KAA9191468.1 hypothetical protein F6Y12_06545 [Enterococcus durans]KAA9193537.1 hypothetical protein F6X88_06700 [Enterococcus durans]
MVFEQLGEPIKLGEYLYRYEEMIRHILGEMTFADFESKKIKTMLRAEMRKAETSFYIFYDQNRREPDYAFLQRKVTEFGVERLEIFQPEKGFLSLDNFVYRYLERLKTEKLLTGLVFAEQDLFFVQKYEANRAKNYYEENNEYLQGYEQERISINPTIQRLGYEKLKRTFLEDPLIQSLRKERKGLNDICHFLNRFLSF